MNEATVIQNNNYKVPVKLSIIIPINGIFPNIKQCIDSVINQNLQDISITILTTCNFDKDLKLLEEYSKIDKRIKYIYRKNGDINLLINEEIHNSNSEYIAILDANCILEQRAYEVLYYNAKRFDCEVCKSAFNNYNRLSNHNINFYNIFESFPYEEFTLNIHNFALCNNSSIWAGIYKSDFIKQIKFTGKNYYADFPVTIEILLRAKRIFIVKEYLFRYNEEKYLKLNNKKLLDIPKNFLIAKEILLKYSKETYYENFKHFFNYHTALIFLHYKEKIKLKYLKRYLKDAKKVFIDIKDEEFRYPFLNENDKKLLKKFERSNLTSYTLGEYYKRLKKFIKNDYEDGIYRRIVLFNFIRINKKPLHLLLQHLIRIIDMKIDNLTNKAMQNKLSHSPENFIKTKINRAIENHNYGVLYETMHDIWFKYGSTDELIDLFNYTLQNENVRQFIHHEYYLMHISCLYERGFLELAKENLYSYINRFGTKRIRNFLLVSKLAFELNIKNDFICKSAFVYDRLEENRKNKLFESIIKGKSVAIVGNGPSEIGKGKGGKIDSYDIVIRFNNYRLKGYENDYGSKTDMRITGFGGCDLEYSLSGNYLINAIDGEYINHQIFNEEQLEIMYKNFRKNKKSFCFFAQDYHKNLMREFGHKFPSTGLSAIYSVYKIKENFNEKLSIDDLYGFQFLEDIKNNRASHYFNDRSEEVSVNLSLVHDFNYESEFIKKLFKIER